MNDVRFISTIHDEVNFAIKKERVFEITDLIVKAMSIKLPDWPFGMEVGVEIGKTWGTTFKFNTKERPWIPEFEVKQDTEITEEGLYQDDIAVGFDGGDYI